MNKQMIWPEGERRAALALDGQRSGAADAVDVGRLLAAVRRQAWVVGLCAFVGLALAVASLVTTKPLYTAHSAILLDAERADLLNLVSELPSAVVGDASVQSEVEILKSRELALRVVDRLDLVANPVPLTTPPSVVEQAVEGAKNVARAVLALVEPADEEAAAALAAAQLEADPRLALALALRNNLVVERIGRSYVFDVAYTAPTPDLAARITNAYADAYLDYQLEANASSSEAAAEWLRGRVETLRQASLDATRELDRFRRENNLVSVGERLLSEQQASELMSQLILAEADASRAEAVARQAAAAVAGGAGAAAQNLTSTDGGEGSTATLLADYTAAERQRRRVVAEFGTDHPEAERLAGEIARLDDLIFDALQRRLTTARNAAEAAESRVTALRNGLQAALLSSQTDEDVTSRLTQLEQTAESYTLIYRDYLTRLEQAVQQQSVPIVPARVISGADVPEGASSPSKAKVLAIGLFLGLFAGAAVGTVREMRRDRLDGPDDVERLTGVRAIATLPRMPRWRALGGGSGKRWRRKSRALPGREVDAAVAKALRAVKLALDDAPGRRPGRTVGISSARPGEGRTTLAILLGSMLARHGFSTVLIDASDGSLAETFGPSPTADLVSLARAGRPDFEALPRTGPEPLTILRLSPADDPAAGILLAGTRTMAEAFDAIGKAFDYVILDLPALSEGRDATALSRHLDTAVIVNRPGQGRATEVAALTADIATPSVAGVILNRR